MKVRESFAHEASKPDKNEKPKPPKNVRQSSAAEQSAATSKTRETDSPQKNEAKFASILTSSLKTQKPVGQREDPSEERRDDQKRERKHSAQEKTVGERLIENGDAEGNGSFGGQNSFGTGSNINQTALSQAFAARSILHIADLERLISTIRTHTNLKGRRETIIKLKNSVLEGLQVRVLTDPAANVKIEFLASNEKVRQQIEENSEELAEIIRGRGIDLESIQTRVDSSDSDDRDAFFAETQNF